MSIYNVDAGEQFNYKRSDYKKNEKWKSKAKKRRNIYIIGMSTGMLVLLGGFILNNLKIEFRDALGIIFIGGFFGWIPGLSYSRLLAGKCMEIGPIEKRSHDLVIIDEEFIRYLYNEYGYYHLKRGFKISLEEIQSINCNKDRRMITIYANEMKKVVYSTREGRETMEDEARENEAKKQSIEIPMYFEYNEELLKELEESMKRKVGDFEIKYI